MFATKLVFLLAFSFFILTSFGDGTEPAQGSYNDGMSPPAQSCGNCSICPYTCNTAPPPPPPALGYPSYGISPPPPPTQASCPPAPPVQCCQTSPPSPFYHPYDSDSGGPAQLQPLIKPFTSTWCLAIFFVSVMSLDLLA